MTTFNILNQADCAKRIAKIGKVGQALQNDIHVVAVSTLDHIREHGDYTLALSLFAALPNGQRVKALGFWYGKFSNGKAVFSYDSSNKCWKCKLSQDRDDADFQIEKASEVTFADLVPEKGYSTLTLKGFVEMLKRKANEDGLNPDGTPKVEPAVRTIAADFYAQLKEAGKKVENLTSLDDMVTE